MNPAAEFALLAYDDDGSSVIDGTRLDDGLAGALLDLALTSRLDVEDNRVVVRDPDPAGDPPLDQAAAAVRKIQAAVMMAVFAATTTTTTAGS